MDRIQNGWVQTNGQSAPRPKSIYCVSSDFPWGDQSYERYGLAQMQTVKRVVSAQIVQERLSPYSIIADTWRNGREVPEGRNPDDYKVGFQTGQDFSLTNSVETSWNAQVTAGSSTTVSVEVGGDAMGGKVGVSQTMSLEVSAGTGGRNEQDVAVGVNRSVSAELCPSEATDVVIVSQKGDLLHPWSPRPWSRDTCGSTWAGAWTFWERVPTISSSNWSKTTSGLCAKCRRSTSISTTSQISSCVRTHDPVRSLSIRSLL
jgi:hypothetical protein